MLIFTRLQNHSLEDSTSCFLLKATKWLHLELAEIPVVSQRVLEAFQLRKV